MELRWHNDCQWYALRRFFSKLNDIFIYVFTEYSCRFDMIRRRRWPGEIMVENGHDPFYAFPIKLKFDFKHTWNSHFGHIIFTFTLILRWPDLFACMVSRQWKCPVHLWQVSDNQALISQLEIKYCKIKATTTGIKRIWNHSIWFDFSVEGPWGCHFEMWLESCQRFDYIGWRRLPIQGLGSLWSSIVCECTTWISNNVFGLGTRWRTLFRFIIQYSETMWPVRGMHVDYIWIANANIQD